MVCLNQVSIVLQDIVNIQQLISVFPDENKITPFVSGIQYFPKLGYIRTVVDNRRLQTVKQLFRGEKWFGVL